ncbi:hypothetical protein [uncultured Tyzzerella sp.]|uniref:hypothetical protein n=1 Tax=uncultured Tyzzerella sp. TaxID=2321398 RepID=UPI00294347D3|nr:hypothetical protein [uncultured Tyzzerella sp.]
MNKDINIENEKAVSEFFVSEKSQGTIIELNVEDDYIIIEDFDTKELIKAEVGTGLADALSDFELPIFTCYDKKTKRTVNP